MTPSPYRIMSHENGGVVLIGRNEAASVRLRCHAENRLRPMRNRFGGERSRFVPTGRFGWAVYFQSHEEMRQLFASLAFTIRARTTMNLGGPPPSFGEKDLARADKMIAKFVPLEHKVAAKIPQKRKNPLDLLGVED